jgi:hypothetical protein
LILEKMISLSSNGFAPIAIHVGVVSVGERVRDPVLDQQSGAVFVEFVVRGFPVVVLVSGEDP